MDSARWENAVREWIALAHREGVSANLEAAQGIQARTRRLLNVYSHDPDTRTPSPEGSYPARITGRLAASIDARHVGEDAWVGPTDAASSKNGPYGRFLELGGTHVAHSGAPYIYPDGSSSGPQMWWREGKSLHHAGVLKKAPRPYLEPATDAAIASGEIYDTYWRHWLIAQEAVTS